MLDKRMNSAGSIGHKEDYISFLIHVLRLHGEKNGFIKLHDFFGVLMSYAIAEQVKQGEGLKKFNLLKDMESKDFISFLIYAAHNIEQERTIERYMLAAHMLGLLDAEAIREKYEKDKSEQMKWSLHDEEKLKEKLLYSILTIQELRQFIIPMYLHVSAIELRKLFSAELDKYIPDKAYQYKTVNGEERSVTLKEIMHGAAEIFCGKIERGEVTVDNIHEKLMEAIDKELDNHQVPHDDKIRKDAPANGGEATKFMEQSAFTKLVKVSDDNREDILKAILQHHEAQAKQQQENKEKDGPEKMAAQRPPQQPHADKFRSMVITPQGRKNGGELGKDKDAQAPQNVAPQAEVAGAKEGDAVKDAKEKIPQEPSALPNAAQPQAQENKQEAAKSAQGNGEIKADNKVKDAKIDVPQEPLPPPEKDESSKPSQVNSASAAEENKMSKLSYDDHPLADQQENLGDERKQAVQDKQEVKDDKKTIWNSGLDDEGDDNPDPSGPKGPKM